MARTITEMLGALEYSPEQKENILSVLDVIEKFVDREIPHERAYQWDKAGVKLSHGEILLPDGMPELYDKIKNELGLPGLLIPEAYGGAGLPYITLVAAVEIFSRREPGVAVQLAVHASAIDAIMMFGTEEQKQQYLPAMASGEKLGAIVFTEPQAGSDVGAGTTSAELHGDHYVINGGKIFITGTGISSLYFMSAATDPKNPSKNRRHSTFILDIPEHGQGHRVVRLEDKLVLKTSPTGQLELENVRVPASCLLGAPGKGVANLLTMLNNGRIEIAAQAVGIAQGAFDLAASYAGQRTQFDEKIINFQAINFDLAEMATEIAAARQLTYYAAWMKDHATTCINNTDLVEACSKAKLFSSRMSTKVCGRALEVFGGYGVCTEYHVERYYRNAKITEIYEGTSNIQRLTLGRIIGTRYATEG